MRLENRPALQSSLQALCVSRGACGNLLFGFHSVVLGIFGRELDFDIEVRTQIHYIHTSFREC